MTDGPHDAMYADQERRAMTEPENYMGAAGATHYAPMTEPTTEELLATVRERVEAGWQANAALTLLETRMKETQQALWSANDTIAAGGPTDQEARDLFVEEHNRAEALRAQRDEAVSALRGAPAFIGVWNVEGRRSVDDESLGRFVESYNAWAENVRAFLRSLSEGQG